MTGLVFGVAVTVASLLLGWLQPWRPRRPILIVTIGAPGTGKTRAVDQWIRAKQQRVRVSRDALRVACGRGGDRDSNERWFEAAITIAQHAMVNAWLSAGLNVAIDDTCQNQATLRRWIRIARFARARLVLWDFRGVPTTVAAERDLARGASGGRQVGEDVISVVAGRCAGVVVPPRVKVLKIDEEGMVSR